MKSIPRPATKSNSLRLVPEKPSTPMRLSGLEAAPDMEAGEYLAQCLSADYEKSKNRVVLQFVIVDGPHTGTAVPEYIPGVNGRIQPAKPIR